MVYTLSFSCYFYIIIFLWEQALNGGNITANGVRGINGGTPGIGLAENIIINDGIITATGGNGTIEVGGGAGIGGSGGTDNNINWYLDGGNIVINGGTVTANGGNGERGEGWKGSGGGAGIGGGGSVGFQSSFGGTSSTITISHTANVVATGGTGGSTNKTTNAANIGAGSSEDASGIFYFPDPPTAPTLASNTANSITLTANPYAEYSKDNGITWQASPVFDGLTAGMAYIFRARIAYTNPITQINYYRSAPSESALISTMGNGVPYIDANGETHTKPLGEMTVVSSDIDSLNSGWYLFIGSWVTGYIGMRDITTTINGDVHLILADDCNVNLYGGAGITIPSGSSLTIYAQSTGVNMGKLIASGGGIQYTPDRPGIHVRSGASLTINGGEIIARAGTGNVRIPSGSAGIGGSSNENSGEITINGGNITARGKGTGAGIGGGGYNDLYSGNGGTSGPITITGNSIISATGDPHPFNYFSGGAGIGGGGGVEGGASGVITIIGNPTITAEGYNGGAGIGGGGGGGASQNGVGGVCETVTIIGNPSISATGGSGFGAGADIGSGGGSNYYNDSAIPNTPYPATPSAPTLASRTETSIILNTITGNSNLLYGYNTTDTAPNTWQDSPVFTRLSENKTYYFFAHIPGTDIINLATNMPCYTAATSAGTAIETMVNTSAPDDVEAFVTRIYNHVLERDPDPEGLKHWVNGLKAGHLTAGNIIYEFFFNIEFESKIVSDEEFITLAYNTFMNRPPGEEGIEFWVDSVLASGYSRWYVLDSMMKSIEFISICQLYGIPVGVLPPERADNTANVEAFVMRMYQYVLLREPDPEGLEHWKNGLLNGNLTAANLIDEFFFSSEFMEKSVSDEEYIEIAFNTFMNRPPGEEGIEFWADYVLASGYSHRYVLDSMMKSVEFIAICKLYNITVGVFIV